MSYIGTTSKKMLLMQQGDYTAKTRFWFF